MGLNIVIYQALLYVSIIAVVAVLISYISHKTRKPFANQRGYLRTPNNYMKSIQKEIYHHQDAQHLYNRINNMPQQDYRGQIYNLETGQAQNQLPIERQTFRQNYVPQNNNQTSYYYKRAASGNIGRDTVYFR
jgi:uncharacterized protein (UPF0305 family)